AAATEGLGAPRLLIGSPRWEPVRSSSRRNGMARARSTKVLAGMVVAALLAMGGCGDDGGDDPTAAPPDEPAGGRGWIGGEPDWRGGAEVDEMGAGGAVADGASTGEMTRSESDDGGDIRVDPAA